MPYLQRTSPQYASASSGNSATMFSKIPDALSNSFAARRRFARPKRVIFFSLSAVGTVCLVPQYSHSQTLMPSVISRSPPHILHFSIVICLPSIIVKSADANTIYTIPVSQPSAAKNGHYCLICIFVFLFLFPKLFIKLIFSTLFC